MYTFRTNSEKLNTTTSHSTMNRKKPVILKINYNTITFVHSTHTYTYTHRIQKKTSVNKHLT